MSTLQTESMHEFSHALFIIMWENRLFRMVSGTFDDISCTGKRRAVRFYDAKGHGLHIRPWPFRQKPWPATWQTMTLYTTKGDLSLCKRSPFTNGSVLPHKGHYHILLIIKRLQKRKNPAFFRIFFHGFFYRRFCKGERDVGFLIHNSRLTACAKASE